MELSGIKEVLIVAYMPSIVCLSQNNIWILENSFFIYAFTSDNRVIHRFDYKHFSIFYFVNWIDCWPIFSRVFKSTVIENMPCIIMPHIIHRFRFFPNLIEIILIFLLYILIEMFSQYLCIILSLMHFFKLKDKPKIVKPI